MTKHEKHRMRSTSLKAYDDFDESELAHRQLQVLNAIRELNNQGRNPTDWEITEHLGFKDPNKVRPRRYDLMEKGYIVEHEKRTCTVTGKTSLTWKLSPQYQNHIKEVWWSRASEV